ncbi:heterokaryon incompatibility protein-domain-containing protein, partial [Lophiotrema nucula]
MRKFLSFRSRHLHDRTLKPSSNAVASSPSDGGKPHREDALYEYEYLPEGYIRILELLPGALEDPLRCKLVPVKLSEAPNYAAISYVWGDNSVTDVLHIGDKILRITLNLRDALTRLRFQHRPLSLWADAVCINQRNLAEKTHQVQIMGLIYYRASLVNVWLGNLSTDEQT